MNFLKRWRNKAPIIIVSGLPRSGTSLMMQMLTAGGIMSLTDAHRPADDNNPRGYYEYESTKRLHLGDTLWLPDARGKVVKIISHQLNHLPDSETYHIVFMRRHIEEIVNSQATMLIRQGNQPSSWDVDKLIRDYEQHIIYITRWLEAQNNMTMLTVSYSELLNPIQQAQQVQNLAQFIATALQQRLNIDAMLTAIDPQLYRHRQPQKQRKE